MSIILVISILLVCLLNCNSYSIRSRLPYILSNTESSLLSASISPQSSYCKHPLKRKNDLLSNCTEHYIKQYLDHYNYKPPPSPYNNITTFMERYFICGGSNWTPNSTIFFYTGNEAEIELYINNTGLMWENADSFNAIMVFAEHRYWGKSIPFSKSDIYENRDLLSFISPQQAIADYANLIYHLKTKWNSIKSTVVGFGGSYGAILCYWMKIKFPQFLDGCISGSAPIFAWMGVRPPINEFYYAQTQTFDASTAGGSDDLCKYNIHSSWSIIWNWSKTETGRIKLKNALNLCRIPMDEFEGNMTANWIKSAMNSMAMGSYPYPSSYFINGKGLLPPFPLRIGCNYMIQNFSLNQSFEQIVALGKLVGVIRNFTNDTQCYNIIGLYDNNETIKQVMITDHWTGYVWDYMYCTGELLIIHGKNGINDMFWYDPWNITKEIKGCFDAYGIKTRVYKNEIDYGGRLPIVNRNGINNMVFSNGELDPWNNGGVHVNNTKNNIYGINTGFVGHHIDLMFSTNKDPQSVIDARQFELEQIKHWIEKRNIVPLYIRDI
eukprot:134074_1